MTDYTELLARLEKATEADTHDLSAEVAKAVGTYEIVDGRFPSYPLYCESIDAALTLVPEGWHASIHTEGHVKVWPPMPDDLDEYEKWRHETGALNLKWFFRAETPALALVIAALRARRDKGR